MRTVNRRKERAFYGSTEWKEARAIALREQGKRCRACGTTRGPFDVDHVVPLRVGWQSRTSQKNLMVLCRRCNRGRKRVADRRWR